MANELNHIETYAIIYVLTDHRHSVFYVGCTTVPLEIRLSGHITEARKNWRYTNTVKNLKIQSLKFRVLIKEIDRVLVVGKTRHYAGRSAKQVEMSHIAKYYKKGCALVNGKKEIAKALQSTGETITA